MRLPAAKSDRTKMRISTWPSESNHRTCRQTFFAPVAKEKSSEVVAVGDVAQVVDLVHLGRGLSFEERLSGRDVFRVDGRLLPRPDKDTRARSSVRG